MKFHRKLGGGWNTVSLSHKFCPEEHIRNCLCKTEWKIVSVSLGENISTINMVKIFITEFTTSVSNWKCSENYNAGNFKLWNLSERYFLMWNSRHKIGIFFPQSEIFTGYNLTHIGIDLFFLLKTYVCVYTQDSLKSLSAISLFIHNNFMMYEIRNISKTFKLLISLLIGLQHCTFGQWDPYYNLKYIFNAQILQQFNYFYFLNCIYRYLSKLFLSQGEIVYWLRCEVQLIFWNVIYL